MTKHPLTKDYVAVSAFELFDGTRIEFAEDGSPRVIATAAQQTPVTA